MCFISVLGGTLTGTHCITRQSFYHHVAEVGKIWICWWNDGWFSLPRFLVSQGNCPIASHSFLILPFNTVNGWAAHMDDVCHSSVCYTAIVLFIYLYIHWSEIQRKDQHQNRYSRVHHNKPIQLISKRMLFGQTRVSWQVWRQAKDNTHVTISYK